MLSLGQHGCADRLRPACNDAVFLFFGSRCQQQVQLVQIAHLRHRYQMVPPKLPAFAFYTAFFVTFSWSAELRLKSPVRAERDEPRRLLALVSPQDFLYRALQVVVTQHPKYAAKMRKRQLVRFQKRLLGCVWICPMESAPARHAAQAEQIRLTCLAVELRPALVPIHLPFVAPRVRLCNECLPPYQPHRRLLLAHISPHRRFGHFHFGHLAPHSRPDTVRRVPLLARRFAVAFQNPVDKGNRRHQLRPLPLRYLPLPRQRSLRNGSMWSSSRLLGVPTSNAGVVTGSLSLFGWLASRERLYDYAASGTIR